MPTPILNIEAMQGGWLSVRAMCAGRRAADPTAMAGGGVHRAGGGGSAEQGFLIFFPEIGFFNAVVDEIPGQPFRFGFFAEDEKVGIDGSGLEGLGPVAPKCVSCQQDMGNPPVAPRQQGLDVGPAGNIGVHAHVGDFFKAVFNGMDLGFEQTLFVHGHPLEGCKGLRHKATQAYRDFADTAAGAG